MKKNFLLFCIILVLFCFFSAVYFTAKYDFLNIGVSLRSLQYLRFFVNYKELDGTPKRFKGIALFFDVNKEKCSKKHNLIIFEKYWWGIDFFVLEKFVGGCESDEIFGRKYSEVLEYHKEINSKK